MGQSSAITGPEPRQKLYRELSPSFFDLIVIDECHRGSAADDSAWREILEYYSSATQIGLTATPKETEYASNIQYFGEPVYTYSLKQGIRDGFLAPYKVVKAHLDVDVEGYRPAPGETDDLGNEIDDRIYNQKDFDRSLVIDERTKRVAGRITKFLKESGDRFQKTIVFCVDQERAARMRQALINGNADLATLNDRYVMRITGNDPAGIAQIDNFIDPESKYPVIVTTSRLLSTGVDAQTCLPGPNARRRRALVNEMFRMLSAAKKADNKPPVASTRRTPAGTMKSALTDAIHRQSNSAVAASAGTQFTDAVGGLRLRCRRSCFGLRASTPDTASIVWRRCQLGRDREHSCDRQLPVPLITELTERSTAGECLFQIHTCRKGRLVGPFTVGSGGHAFFHRSLCIARAFRSGDFRRVK